MAVKNGTYVYSYPSVLNDLYLKIRVDETAISQVFPFDNEIDYTTYQIAQGETIALDESIITFKGFNRAPAHPNYFPEEGDIAVSAILEIQSNGITEIAEPIFIIRNRETFLVKDFAPNQKIHAQFTAIDPKTEKIDLRLAKSSGDQPMILLIAEDVPRSDFIVLESIIFPGINLFWLGSVLMLFGVFFAMVRKWIN